MHVVFHAADHITRDDGSNHTDKNLRPVVANNVNLNYIIDQVWPWGTGTGTATGAGQFNFSKYGVRTEYGMNLILSSTDGVRMESALTFCCRYGTEYGRFSKSRCGYGFRTRIPILKITRTPSRTRKIFWLFFNPYIIRTS